MILDTVIRFFSKPFGVAKYQTHRGDVEKIIPILENLIIDAKSSIKIASGEMFFGVYNHPTIVQAIESQIRNGVKVEIVRSPEIDPKTVEIPRLAKHGKLAMYKLPEEPRHHFWLIDNRNVLDEDPHATNERDRNFYIIKNAGFLAETLSKEFSERVRKSILISAEPT